MSVISLYTLGLLSNPPKESEEDLYGYLDECIVETTAGGRFEAMDALRQMLETWAYGDDESDGGLINEDERGRGGQYDEDEGNYFIII